MAKAPPIDDAAAAELLGRVARIFPAPVAFDELTIGWQASKHPDLLTSLIACFGVRPRKTRKDLAPIGYQRIRPWLAKQNGAIANGCRLERDVHGWYRFIPLAEAR